MDIWLPLNYSWTQVSTQMISVNANPRKFHEYSHFHSKQRPATFPTNVLGLLDRAYHDRIRVHFASIHDQHGIDVAG